MSFSIKKVGASEIEDLRDIGIRSYIPHYSHLWKPGGLEWYMDRCFNEKILAQAVGDANIEYYIAQDSGENVGMMKLVLKQPLPESKNENALYLEKIYFIKEATGKGFGKILMNHAFSRAKELHRECVWLMAMDTSDKPIKAYENAGFIVNSYTNLGDEFALMKEEFRGMVVMKNCFKN